MREYSRLLYLHIMDLKFKFNANEFAKLNGITPSALRKRRLSGKLEGQYVEKNGKYFYSHQEIDRPIKDSFTQHNSRSKIRRRNVPDSQTNYHKARNGHQLKLTNDLRQLARINRSLNEEQIAEITDDIFEVAKQRRLERIRKLNAKHEKSVRKKNYGGFINPNFKCLKDFKTNWRPLFPETRNEYDRYLDEIDNSPFKPKYY
jgi:hypothetical protein